MAILRFWVVCLMTTVLLPFPGLETRPLRPYFEGIRNRSRSRNAADSFEATMVGTGKVVGSHFGLQNNEDDDDGRSKSRYQTQRSSPGGPDPQHHSKNE
ncbi:hypothetical protein U1Q18_009297 [Sarracenia purpurea var. burkii]